MKLLLLDQFCTVKRIFIRQKPKHKRTTYISVNEISDQLQQKTFLRLLFSKLYNFVITLFVPTVSAKKKKPKC